MSLFNFVIIAAVAVATFATLDLANNVAQNLNAAADKIDTIALFLEQFAASLHKIVALLRSWALLNQA